MVKKWKKKWKDKVCGITRGRLRPGKNKHGQTHVVFLKCSLGEHGFYRNPLIEWIKNCPSDKPTCPMCRESFEGESILG
jgi:hypothetical protein